MKKCWCGFSVILLLTLLFIPVSCDDESMNKNPLIGTWEDSNENYIERFEFTDTEIISTYQSLAINNNIEPVVSRGTYQYYDTVIIFRMENGLKMFADYSIQNNELTLTFSHNGNTVKYQKK